MKKLNFFKKGQKDVFAQTRTKLTLFYSSILTLFLLLFVAIALSVFLTVTKDDQEETLLLLSDREVQMAERALFGSGSALKEQQIRTLAGNQVFYYITDNSGDLTINMEDVKELRPVYAEFIEGWKTDEIEFKRAAINLPAGNPVYDEYRDMEREVLIIARPLYHNGYQIAMLYLAVDNTFFSSFINWIVVVFMGIALLFIFLGVILSWWMAKRTLVPIEGAYNLQREFVSNASHELRTPLSVILSAVEVLDMEADRNNPFTLKMLGTLKQEVKRMSKLITELLALATTDSQQAVAELKKDWFDAHQLAEQVINAFSKKSEEKRLQLYLDAPESLMVYGDRDKIAQLLYILTDNAIKYTQDGDTIEINLQKHTKKKGEEFNLSVADSGIGLDTEDQAKIFNRFYRVDKARTRKEGGYGLGLPIAKSIAEAHGGTISVKSVSGEGSVFKVVIPYQQLQPSAQQQMLQPINKSISH